MNFIKNSNEIIIKYMNEKASKTCLVFLFLLIISEDTRSA